MVRTLFTKYRGANQVQLHFRSVKLVLQYVRCYINELISGYDVTKHEFLFESILILLRFIEKQVNIFNWLSNSFQNDIT